jgi:hypothetical protein
MCAKATNRHIRQALVSQGKYGWPEQSRDREYDISIARAPRRSGVFESDSASTLLYGRGCGRTVNPLFVLLNDSGPADVGVSLPTLRIRILASGGISSSLSLSSALKTDVTAGPAAYINGQPLFSEAIRDWPLSKRAHNMHAVFSVLVSRWSRAWVGGWVGGVGWGGWHFAHATRPLPKEIRHTLRLAGCVIRFRAL